MKDLRTSKTDTETQGATNPGAGDETASRRGLQAPEARWVGEHLVCSPCGRVASRARWQRLAGSGGAAVALADSKPYIIPARPEFKA